MGMQDMSWGTPRFTTLVDNGDPARRLDIALIGDGYTARQQTTFRRDAAAVVDEFRGTEPIKTYFQHLNFHRIDVISAESGADDMHASPAITRRTALDTYFSPISDRRLVGPDAWVMTVATMSGCPWDAILVIVNYRFYGGATSPLMLIGYTSRGRRTRSGGTATGSFTETVVHEAGHSIAKLLDEYTGDLPDIDLPLDFLPDIAPFANVSASGTNPKWKPWLTSGVQLPTPDSAPGNPVGAFKGAMSMTSDLFRPQKTCYMRDSGKPFCPVCSEQWIKVIYEKSRLADSFTPPPHPLMPTSVTPAQTLTFHANLVRPPGALIRTTWSIRRGFGRWRRMQRTDDYADFSTTFPVDVVGGVAMPTQWRVRCLLEDISPLLRQRPALNAARQEVEWQIVSTAFAGPHADAIIPHGDVNLVPHGDAFLIPHVDVSVAGHGDAFVIPHGDVSAGGHGDVSLVPHGDAFVVPHGDIPAMLHGDIGVASHGDVTLFHGDSPPSHSDFGLGLLHVDSAGSHGDTPGLHTDTPQIAHVDTPTVGHVDTPPVHVDTPASAHVDSPAIAHLDTPPGGHVDTPQVAHGDTPPGGHVDSPATGHVDTPPQHVDAP